MEKYLHKCLDSLVVSTENMLALEVLVVNDGSKDSSLQIANEFASLYPQTFRVIDKENGNYGSCVNRGLKEANGKYVKVLDADDYFDTDAFETAMNFLKNCDYDLILTDYNKVDEKGNVEKMFELTIPHNIPLTFDSLLGFSSRRMHMHRIFYRTDNLRAINYQQTEGMSYTDQEWMGEPMTTVNTLYYMDVYLYQYLVGREGQTMNPKVMLKSIKQYMHAIYVLVDLYIRYTGDEAHKKYIWYRLYGQIWIIYSMFLCEYSQIDLTPLFEFDEKIMQLSPEIYSIGEAYSIGKFKVVAHWRNKRYSHSTRWIPAYYKIVKKVRSFKTLQKD
ncbi:MAG: glycosyltransferase [Bacteroidaceae bacterium]|nr:glycosyltransferase [Bacteroidaceae bacterium]